MNPTAYTPEPGSPVARVLDLLARNPEDDYTNTDLALKFQVKAAAWPPTLAKAKALGLVSYKAADEDDPKAWAAGPNLAAWVAARTAPAGTSTTPPPPAAAPAATAAPSKRGGIRPQLPPIDLSALVVEHGVPVAPRGVGKPGESKWAPVLALLKQPGDSLPLPMPYRHAVYAYVKKAIKAGQLKGTYIVRPCVKELGKCRVSRTA